MRDDGLPSADAGARWRTTVAECRTVNTVGVGGGSRWGAAGTQGARTGAGKLFTRLEGWRWCHVCNFWKGTSGMKGRVRSSAVVGEGTIA